MASGKTHDRITWSLSPFVAIAAYVVAQNPWTASVTLVGFMMGGLMMGPDLDTRSIQYRRWGIFKFLWYPYLKLMPHRGFWSHGPIVGTLIRVLYIASLITGISFLIAYFNFLAAWQITHWENAMMVAATLIESYKFQWLAAIVGLELGACSHYVTDWLTTAIKRKTSRRSRRRRQHR